MAKQNQTEKRRERMHHIETTSLGPDPTLNPALSGEDAAGVMKDVVECIEQEVIGTAPPEIMDALNELKPQPINKTIKEEQSPTMGGQSILHRPCKTGLALGDPVKKLSTNESEDE